MTLKKDETLVRIMNLVLKHDAMLVGAGNVLANHAVLLKSQMPKCTQSECQNPATMSRDKYAEEDPVGKTCDHCLAKILSIYPGEKQDEALKTYYDLPYAALIRSLNDYVDLVESVIPAKVH